MSTFRRIGSRANLQGGSNYNNLLVVNQLSAGYNFNNEPRPVGTNPLPIQLNPTESFLQDVIDLLKLNTTFLTNLSTNTLRVFIRQQLSNLPAIALLVQPYVFTNLLSSSSTFVNGLAQTLVTDFLPLAKSLLLNNTTFLTTAMQYLMQYLPTIEASISISTIEYVANTIVVNLASFTNVPFREIFTNFIPPFTLQDETIKAQYTNKYVSTRNYYEIPPSYLYNSRVIPFLEQDINAGCVYSLIFSTTPFVTSSNTNVLSRINISVIRKDSLTTFQTLFNQVYNPPVAASNALNFTGQLIYGSLDLTVYICVTCYLTDGSYVTSSITTFINKTKQYYTSIYAPMRYATEMDVSKSTVVQRDYEDSIIDSHTVINSAFKGVVQYQLKAPLSTVWWVYFNVISHKSQTFKDLNTYVAALSNRANFTDVNPSLWTYVRGRVIQLVKYNSEGTAQWCSVITPKVIPVGEPDPIFELIDMYIDSKSKIYVGFYHYVGDWDLIAIQPSNAEFTIDTQRTPFRENSFVVVFNYDGSVLGSMKIFADSDDYARLRHLSVPEYSNAVYIAVSKNTDNLVRIKGFDNAELSVPDGSMTFVAKVRNIGVPLYEFDEWWMLASTPVGNFDTFVKIVVTNVDNVNTLFYTTGYPISYYPKNNDTTPNITQLTKNTEFDSGYKTYSLASYILDGQQTLWAFWISSKSFILDKAELLLDNALFLYVLLPLDSNGTIYFSDTDFILLPPTATESTYSYILFRFSSGAFLESYAFLTNAKNAKMKLFPQDSLTDCVIDFEYTDIISVYGNDSYTTPAFQFGEVGDKGNATVMFNTLLVPTYIGRTS
jgi:hypothetical protein